jgi:hypothetical protein
MDLNGRFNFWQMLLQTRTVIPPRLRESRWLPWASLLLLVGVAAGAAVHFSLQESPLQATVSDQSAVDTVAKPAAKPAVRAPSW